MDGINSFDEFVDLMGVDWIAETLYLGPQAEVLEKIDNFNSRFSSDVAVTPKFRWKPGTYDKIKEVIMSSVLGWNRRAQSTVNLVERMDNTNYWRRSLKDALSEIEEKLYMLRYDNQGFIDNTDSVVEGIEVAKGAIIRFEEEFNSISPDRAGLNIDYFVDNHAQARYKHKITFKFTIFDHPDTIMNVIFNNEIVQRLPLQEITFETKINFYDIINSLIQNDYDMQKACEAIHTCGFSGYYAGIDNDGTLHPYINIRPRDIVRSPDGIMNGSMCFGDYTSQIDRGVKMFDPNVAMLMLNWTSKFTLSRTNPWNAINLLHLGLPEDMSEIYRNNIAPHSADCFARLSRRQEITEVVNTCDTIKCTLREVCTGYAGLKIYYGGEEEDYMNLQMIIDLMQHHVDRDPSDAYEPSNWGEYLYDAVTGNDRISTLRDSWIERVFYSTPENEEDRMVRIFSEYNLDYYSMTNEQRTRAAATLNIRS